MCIRDRRQRTPQVRRHLAQPVNRPNRNTGAETAPKKPNGENQTTSLAGRGIVRFRGEPERHRRDCVFDGLGYIFFLPSLKNWYRGVLLVFGVAGRRGDFGCGRLAQSTGQRWFSPVNHHALHIARMAFQLRAGFDWKVNLSISVAPNRQTSSNGGRFHWTVDTFYRAIDAVSYTHLTLPTKRIV